MTSDAGLESRPQIRKLPALLINQIAAGEVIERPASVVKELVENSLDAGATRIEVDLEGGGIELVRVRDDGGGIPREELALALSPHATSKIRQAEDLDRIVTMGFRGEALASITSVARVRVVSKPRGQAEAWEICGQGEDISEPRPAAGAPGTLIEVRNLFFNTPARRKFLRTASTEQGRCMEWLTDLAIAHPSVGFMVRCDGRVRLETGPDQEPRQRVLALLGEELEGELIEVRADRFEDARGLTLWGLIGRPAIARATPRAQHVFLNGRAVRDRTIQHALKESYRGLVEPGRHPTAVLLIEMSPTAVDVNVHPAKLEVRFRDQSAVHQAVLHAVREALRQSDLTPPVSGRRYEPGARLPGAGYSRPRDGGEGSPGARYEEHVRPEALVDFLKRGPLPNPSAIRASLDQPLVASGPLEAMGFGDGRTYAEPQPDEALPSPRRADRVLQIHNSFLVTQDESGIVIIDQHALHERVMFERLAARVGREPLESQQLLAPVSVHATRRQMERVEELAALLGRCGIVLRPMGPRTLGVESFPSLLFQRGVDPVEFMTELLEKAESEEFAPSDESALHEVLDMMACKAAIKAGDRMSEQEMEELLRLRESVERSSACPHGRPTSVRLSIEQLEKLFHRR
ncbi:MAG: DNA mismatch repair endonuclease MutL [Phycisphaerales bacterium]|nr:DNA mismatch repair endonuclease MutL [Phycisphaerales bacterium]